MIIASGWILANRGLISATGVSEISWLCYWIGLPALLVVRISDLTAPWGPVADMVWALLLATSASIAITALIAWLWHLPLRSAVAFIHAGYRGNVTFIGLPVVVMAFAGTSDAAQVEAAALVAFAPLVVFYNIAAVVILQIPDGLEWRSAGMNTLRGIASNPILIGIVVGLLLAWMNVSLPVPLQRTLSGLGQMALPLALLSIGGALYGTRIRGNLHWASAAALIKVGLTPLLGWGFAIWIGLEAEATRLMLIFLAAPCAAPGSC